jgi:hypothetical protein
MANSQILVGSYYYRQNGVFHISNGNTYNFFIVCQLLL